MKIVSLDRTIPLFYFSFLCEFLERSNTEVQQKTITAQYLIGSVLLAERKVRAEELGSVYT